MEGKPKKRGRKTKTTDAYDVINVQQNNHSIINIKHQPVTEDTKQILPGYTKAYMDTTYEHCELCWNCCHSFTSISKSIPLKYSNDVFYVYGYFCSYECSARYIFDTMDDNKVWDTYALLNLYYNISNETRGNPVMVAPSKLLLNTFGGHLNIDEYRASFSSGTSHILYIPPIVPISYDINSLGNKPTSDDNKCNFKLYRKKPINSVNNIYNTMNLTMDS